MIARAVGRRNQKKQQMNLIAVEAVEVHPFAADSYRSHEPLYAAVLGVWDRHTAANSSAAQLFALHNGGNDALHFAGGDRPRLGQRLDQLANDIRLLIGLNVGLDRSDVDKIGEFHSAFPMSF